MINPVNLEEVVHKLAHLPPDKLNRILSKLPTDEKAVILDLLNELDTRKMRHVAQNDFLAFVKKVWPEFIKGRHHIKMAELFEKVASGEIRRLIIALPPRHTKSFFASYLFPAWYLGKFPQKKIIQASHTAELAVGFGRQVRNLLDSEEYHEIFPHVTLRPDSKAAGRWDTNFGGSYYATGTGGALSGRGADCAYFNTQICSTRGILPLSKIKVGDEVYGYEHKTKQYIWTRVRAISTQFKPKLINVNGLWLTPEHRAFTKKGYCQAAEVRDIAVLPMWDRFSESGEGSQECIEEIWQCRPEGEKELLFERVRTGQIVEHDMLLRGGEECYGRDMPEVLPRWESQSGRIGMSSMPEEVYTERGGTGESRSKAQYGALLLWKRLLRALSFYAARASSKNNRAMQEMWDTYYQKQNILFEGMLYDKNPKGHDVYGNLEQRESRVQKAGQENLCLLWRRKTTYDSASYRSQPNEPHKGKPNTPMRPLSHTLSYDSIGTCAEDIKGLLSGEGYWVVDLQTDTGNFVANGYLIHNCAILDDALSDVDAQLALHNPEIFNKLYEWYTSGPRQRLQPSGSLIVVGTRWSQKDLTGQILKAAAIRGSDEWTVVEFPALMPSGEPLWPEYWSKESLEALRDELPNHQWMAQFQQMPTSESAAIIKREWWKWWEHQQPPKCESIIQTWDTAHETKTSSDYSACTTWGVWYNEEDNGNPHIILLNAFRERMEFPELKKVAYREWKDWEPDTFVVEKKAAGAPLIQEFRAMGIPVREFSPGRGQDKISRLNAVADIVASGKVWVPKTRWAEEVVDEVAAFPAGEHDDYVDNFSLALACYRQSGYIPLPSDYQEPQRHFRSTKGTQYY